MPANKRKFDIFCAKDNIFIYIFRKSWSIFFYIKNIYPLIESGWNGLKKGQPKKGLGE